MTSARFNSESQDLPPGWTELLAIALVMFSPGVYFQYFPPIPVLWFFANLCIVWAQAKWTFSQAKQATRISVLWVVLSPPAVLVSSSVLSLAALSIPAYLSVYPARFLSAGKFDLIWICLSAVVFLLTVNVAACLSLRGASRHRPPGGQIRHMAGVLMVICVVVPPIWLATFGFGGPLIGFALLVASVMSRASTSVTGFRSTNP